MTTTPPLRICVLPGDGIGVEVIEATVPLLEKLAHGAPFAFAFSRHPAATPLTTPSTTAGSSLPNAT